MELVKGVRRIHACDFLSSHEVTKYNFNFERDCKTVNTEPVEVRPSDVVLDCGAHFDKLSANGVNIVSSSYLRAS